MKSDVFAARLGEVESALTIIDYLAKEVSLADYQDNDSIYVCEDENCNKRIDMMIEYVQKANSIVADLCKEIDA